MENIFFKEEQVIDGAEKILSSSQIETEQDAVMYKALLDEYKKLLKQMMTLIKISDLNHLELNLLSKRLEIASYIDELTGLFNRRHFNEVFQREWQSAVSLESVLSVIMVDIDFFKNYNDVYGHLQGDVCLKSVAKAIKESVFRPLDTVARFGGEEFVVLLPDTDIKGAVHIAESIAKNIEKLNIANPVSSDSEKLTVSMGIASVIPVGDELSNNLIDMSDKALYCAKTEGRNCYRVY